MKVVLLDGVPAWASTMFLGKSVCGASVSFAPDLHHCTRFLTQCIMLGVRGRGDEEQGG